MNPPTCATEGSVEWTTFPHGHWDGVTGTGPGEQSATPVADAHYALTNPGKVTVTVPAKSGLDCPAESSPR